MKLSIDQHQQNIKRSLASLRRKKEDLVMYQSAAEKLEDDCARYSALIDRAISEGKDGFDIVLYGLIRGEE